MTAMLVFLTFALFVLRWMNVFIWTSVAVRLTPSMVRVFRHNTRQYDAIWAMFWGIAVNRLWLWLHGTSFGEVTTPLVAFDLLIGWYVFAIALGCGVHLVRSWYGRGASYPSRNG